MIVECSCRACFCEAVAFSLRSYKSAIDYTSEVCVLLYMVVNYSLSYLDGGENEI